MNWPSAHLTPPARDVCGVFNALRRLWWPAIGAFVIVAASCSSWSQTTVPKIVEQSKPAVVAITTYDKSQNVVSRGTGFFISPEGKVITNRHVLIGAESAIVRSASGEDFPVTAVIGDDATGDLICLRVVSSTPFASLHTAPAEPEPGERILVIGNPLGLQGTVSDGIVAAVRELGEVGGLMQITAPISPGSSGSPVLNLHGEVIGVATSYLASGRNVNFAIPAKRIEAISKSNGEPFGKWVRTASVNNLSAAITLVIRAYYEMDAKNFTAALEHLDQAISLAPDYAPAHLWLGSCYARMNRLSDAITEYKKAIQLDPKDVTAYKRLGAAYSVVGSHTQGAETYLQAIHVDALDSDSHYGLGIVYLDLGQPSQAMAQFVEAIRLAPNVGEYHRSVARLYAAKGQFDTALAEFQEAIRLDPSDASSHYDLALLYLQLGNRSGALEEYRLLKALNDEYAQKLFGMLYP